MTYVEIPKSFIQRVIIANGNENGRPYYSDKEIVVLENQAYTRERFYNFASQNLTTIESDKGEKLSSMGKISRPTHSWTKLNSVSMTMNYSGDDQSVLYAIDDTLSLTGEFFKSPSTNAVLILKYSAF